MPHQLVLRTLSDIQKCKKEENIKNGKFIRLSVILFIVSFIISFAAITFSLLQNYFQI